MDIMVWRCICIFLWFSGYLRRSFFCILNNWFQFVLPAIAMGLLSTGVKFEQHAR
jgi:hypothetical protein